MSETRKNHLSIDGGQVKEDDNVATYKALPDAESEFRSKPTLSKSKEKISDEAEEKLLDKEEEAKIVTRVDMADAKYVVGDHRNGDAKIELDANKRQFSGLTKEELLKYADDPFWVRLRWFMFVLFWALWLCMLAGAIAIIVRAPKCAPPPPKTWYEQGPLVDVSSEPSLKSIEEELPLLQSALVQGIFVEAGSAYELANDKELLEQLKAFVTKAREYGVKVIVDLTPSFVSDTHEWFLKSVNRTAPYDTYFTWAKGKDYIDGIKPSPPNNWISTENTSAWTWSDDRKEFYLRQYGGGQPDLNFHNQDVVKQFDDVLRTVMKTGADGVRLHNVRTILVNQSLPDDVPVGGQGGVLGADHMSYAYYQHRHTSDQAGLASILARWSKAVDDSGSNPGAGETVFTLAEGSRPELSVRNLTSLRPRSASPVTVRGDSAEDLVKDIKKRLDNWPALQLKSASLDEAAKSDEEAELAALAMLLPAAPVLQLSQLAQQESNETSANEKLSHLVSLRDDASIKHGHVALAAVPSADSAHHLVACARWKQGHTGYVAVFNPAPREAVAALPVESVPAALTVHHVSHYVRAYTNYTANHQVNRDSVLVPPKSTVVLSYVPKDAEEQ